jgi:hypothetical protein
MSMNVLVHFPNLDTLSSLDTLDIWNEILLTVFIDFLH